MALIESIDKFREVKVVQAIDASLGTYAAKDVVGADDCCTTLAISWIFEVAKENGGNGYIRGARIFNETENQAAQYDLHLFSAIPNGELRDNAANTNPLKTDKDIFLGTIVFPISVAQGASVATNTQVPAITVGKMRFPFRCAPNSKNIYGVLVTNTAYAQTATDDIEITLVVEQD